MLHFLNQSLCSQEMLGQVYKKFYYPLIALLGLLVPFALMQGWRINWSVPLVFKGDALGWLTTVKSYVEGGNVYFIPHTGAPFDVTAIGQINFNLFILLLIKVLVLFSSDVGLIINLIWLLSFPAIACSAAWCFRQLKISASMALLGAVAYSSLYYHFYRSISHLNLSWYALVPPVCLVCHQIMSKGGLVERTAKWRWSEHRRLIFAQVVFVLLSLTDLYYAFLSCVLFCVSLLLRFLADRKWKSALASFLSVIIPCVAALMIPVLIWYTSMGGGVSVGAIDSRSLVDFEIYGLKLSYLLLPNPEHRIGFLRDLTESYISQAVLAVENEAVYSALGFLGSIGLIYLLIQLFIPRINKRTENDISVWCMSLLCGSLIVLAVIGGLNIFIGLFLTTFIRCYNRYSVYIAFFAIAAGCILVEKLHLFLKKNLIGRYKKALAAICIALLSAFFIWEEVPVTDFELLEKNEETVSALKEFGSQIDDTLENGSMIFYYPAVDTDFYATGFAYDGYEMYAPGLYTNNVRWSVGQTSTQNSLWLQHISNLEADEFLKTIVHKDFDALVLDTKWTEKNRLDELHDELGTLEINLNFTDETQRYEFYDLREYKNEFTSSISPEALHDLDLKANVFMKFSKGFYADEKEDESVFRWMQKHGELTFYNCTEQDLEIEWAMNLTALSYGEKATVTVSQNDAIIKEFELTDFTQRIELEFELPPGETTIELDVDMQDPHELGDLQDTRELYVSFTNGDENYFRSLEKGD